MQKDGFTILEILTVLAVLVILAGITVPRIKGMQDQGRIIKVKAELKTVQNAVEHYYINKHPNAFPATSTKITADILADPGIPQTLEEQMYDPFQSSSAAEYSYVLSGNGLYYVISSVGVDGESGDVVIDDDGVVGMNKSSDDICITNGSGC